MADIDAFDHLRGPGLRHVFTDRDDPHDDARRLIWMAVTAAGGEIRLAPRAWHGDGRWSSKTHVWLDAETGEIVLSVERVAPREG